MNFRGMHVDEALRQFQTAFRLPGEAQKIERLMEVSIGTKTNVKMIPFEIPEYLNQ